MEITTIFEHNGALNEAYICNIRVRSYYLVMHFIYTYTRIIYVLCESSSMCMCMLCDCVFLDATAHLYTQTNKNQCEFRFVHLALCTSGPISTFTENIQHTKRTHAYTHTSHTSHICK